MNLETNKNLLYVLITARCPLSCSFCMTKHLHRNEDLELNEKALESLFRLSTQSKKVCISGEGDPLAAWKLILSIVKKSPPNTHFELITSSYWNKNKTREFLEELSALCVKNNCTLAYRISIDKFHEIEIKRDVLKILLEIFTSTELPNINLQIRSITGQEKYLFDRLESTLNRRSISFEIIKKNPIEYELNSSRLKIKMQFKPTVKPSSFDYKDEWSIDRYIDYLEKSRETDFHIGLMKHSPNTPVYDITINPNGDVVLYGAEPFVIGNIEKEVIDYQVIYNRIQKNEQLSYLTNNRFIDLISDWRKNEKAAELIKIVNNPFWIVRNLHKHELLNLNML